jgi:hypothetical protein
MLWGAEVEMVISLKLAIVVGSQALVELDSLRLTRAGSRVRRRRSSDGTYTCPVRGAGVSASRGEGGRGTRARNGKHDVEDVGLGGKCLMLTPSRLLHDARRLL